MLKSRPQVTVDCRVFQPRPETTHICLQMLQASLCPASNFLPVSDPINVFYFNFRRCRKWAKDGERGQKGFSQSKQRYAPEDALRRALEERDQFHAELQVSTCAANLVANLIVGGKGKPRGARFFSTACKAFLHNAPIWCFKSGTK